MRQRWADVRLGRGLLFLAGVILVGWLVHVAQGERVIAVLGGARQWLPFIIAFELALLMTDLFAIRILLGDKRHCVSPSAWTRRVRRTISFVPSPHRRAARSGPAAEARHGEPARDPAYPIIEHRLVTGKAYAMASNHRTIIESPQTPR